MGEGDIGQGEIYTKINDKSPYQAQSERLKSQLPITTIPDYAEMRDIPGDPLTAGEEGIIYLLANADGSKNIRKYYHEYSGNPKLPLVSASLDEVDCMVRAKGLGILPEPKGLVADSKGVIKAFDAEFIPGQTLADLFGKSGLSLAQAEQAIADMVRMEQVTGMTGVDFKPTNFIIEEGTGRVRFVDFRGTEPKDLDTGIKGDIRKALSDWAYRFDFESPSRIFTTAEAARAFVKNTLDQYFTPEETERYYPAIIEGCNLIDTRYHEEVPQRERGGFYPQEVVKEAEDYVKAAKTPVQSNS